MDESICSGGLRTQMWHTETSLLKKKTISITKYNLCKSGVCDKTSNQRKSTILSSASVLHFSPSSSSSSLQLFLLQEVKVNWATTPTSQKKDTSSE